jgi:hypothetical protein
VTAPINCIGVKFGKLTAIAEAEPKIRKDRGTATRRMLCVCDCGAEKIVSVPDLRSGNTKSCGCYKAEAIKKSNTTHGMSITKARSGKAATEYKIWNGMRGRCTLPNHISYKYYGAKGVKVCERWDNFENFLADMGPRPSPDHSLDRFPNRSGDYSPENCRWATGKEQFANQDVSPEFIAYINRGQGGGVRTN